MCSITESNRTLLHFFKILSWESLLCFLFVLSSWVFLPLFFFKLLTLLMLIIFLVLSCFCFTLNFETFSISLLLIYFLSFLLVISLEMWFWFNKFLILSILDILPILTFSFEFGSTISCKALIESFFEFFYLGFY